MSMTWEYGITTCEQRLKNGLLKETIDSLYITGFTDPVIFFDGMIDDYSIFREEHEISQRSKNLQPFGNWMLAAWELWIRNPKADRYLIFQDDVAAVKGLKDYLSSSFFPSDGYGNLFTFPENQRFTSNKLGWHPAEGGKGLGALGLMFTNPAMAALLQSKNLVLKPQDPHRGWKLIDGGVVTAMNNAGFKEYIHNPSLLQHTGQMKSTFQTKEKQKSHELSPSFPGESKNIKDIMEGPKVKHSQRIGFAGRHCGDDISKGNVEFCKNVDVDRWMIIPHPTKNITYPIPDWLDTTACRNGNNRKIEEFLRTVDILVLFDKDFRYNSMLEIARKKKTTIITIVEGRMIANKTTNYCFCLDNDSCLSCSMHGLDYHRILIPKTKSEGIELTKFIRELRISP